MSNTDPTAFSFATKPLPPQDSGSVVYLMGAVNTLGGSECGPAMGDEAKVEEISNNEEGK